MKPATNNKARLARAVAIAAHVHENQTDKADESYILHPLRLFFRAQSFGAETQMVALLHDVIEDAEPPGSWDEARLQGEGFSETVTGALDLLTRRRQKTHGTEETYAEFVQRILFAPGVSGKIARVVKRLDLEDNMTMTRLKNDLSDSDVARLKEYHAAYRQIKQAETERADAGDEQQ